MSRATRLLATAACLALMAPVAALSAEPGTPPTAEERAAAFDAGAVLNIVPPGSKGSYNAQEAFAAQAGNRPANTIDQLEMYDAINTLQPVEITEARLTEFFKDGALGVNPADVTDTYQPRDGVTVLRDKFGVPHVYGKTYNDVAFGAGYVGTEDRMFLQDALRHVGAARATEFLGPSEANIAMDRDQLRAAAYTEEEAAQQLVNITKRYPEEGPKLVEALNHFIDGINAAQQAMCPAGSPIAPDCPAEYGALQIRPEPFKPTDVVYIASLVGGIFGKGGGGEYTNAKWLQKLIAKFGAVEGRRVYDDLRERNDPEAPTTADTPFPYEPKRPGDPAAIAMPDPTATEAPSTGSEPGASSPAPGSATGVLDIGTIGKLDLRPKADPGMSNALVVNASESATGRPLAVFGPQTGYFAPQLLTEVDLNGPGIAARGVSFAGTQLIVELGHGVDYAWSATSASADNVDLLFEELCNEDGSKATIESTGYLVDGVCKPMTIYTHSQTAKPSAGGVGLPQQVDMVVEKTHHGIVQLRTTAEGKPAALVQQRSTYGSELDSAVGFARINNPDYVKSAADFAKAFAAVDYTFNWLYVDDRDASYFMSGRLPERPTSVDPDLPRWGSSAYDWGPWLSDAEHPQETNPAKGFITSWNNKQAPEFSSSDNQWGYGSVYRSLSLDERILARIEGSSKMTRAGLVGSMQDAAVTDVRGKQLLPELLAVIGADPELKPTLDLLQGWLDRGALRQDRDRDGAYGDQAAIAIMDRWWESADDAGKVSSVAKEVLRPTLGALVDELPKGLDDHPRLGLGSAWNGVPWYGYVDKDLRQVLGRPVQGRYSRTYCGTLPACRTVLRTSLKAAVAAELAAQEKTNVAELTYDKAQDNIRHSAVGVVGVPEIDWQNRPTFQQVVSFSRNRRPTPTRITLASDQTTVTAGNAPLLSGVVTAADGTPVADTTVTVHGLGAGRTAYEQVGTTETDAQGRWELVVRPTVQTAYIAATGALQSAKKVLFVYTRVQVTGPVAGATVPAATTFTGYLIPRYAGVPVGLAYIDREGGFRYLTQQRTDAQGRFTIPARLPAGSTAFVVYTSAHGGTLKGAKSLRLTVR